MVRKHTQKLTKRGKELRRHLETLESGNLSLFYKLGDPHGPTSLLRDRGNSNLACRQMSSCGVPTVNFPAVVSTSMLDSASMRQSLPEVERTGLKEELDNLFSESAEGPGGTSHRFRRSVPYVPCVRLRHEKLACRHLWYGESKKLSSEFKHFWKLAKTSELPCSLDVKTRRTQPSCSAKCQVSDVADPCTRGTRYLHDTSNGCRQ